LLDRHTARLELVHLLAQCVERHDDAVADQAYDVVAQNARRNQMQHGLAIADHEGVPGVVPTLEAHDRMGTVGQYVDDGALALVAPLRPNHDNVSTHN
jgi:hypothetical protein